VDGLVGVGGKWSGGMLQERATARAHIHPVLDLTVFEEPPSPEEMGMSAGRWLHERWRDLDE